MAKKAAEEHIPTSVFDTEQHDQEMRATYPESDVLKPAFLYVERGPGAGQLVQLKPGPLVIGRASVSDLRLQHPSISRRHAQFKRIGEQFFVKDLGSQNGTFVNKDKIETEIEVFPGDLIAMGNALLKLRGPLGKGEALPQVSAKSSASKQRPMKTAVVQRAPAAREPSSNIVKVAIFAGAIGFGLAGVLAFAFVKGASTPPKKTAGSSASAGSSDLGITVDDVTVRHAKKIDEAIARKMSEHQAVVAAERKAAEEKSAAEAPADSAPAAAPTPQEDRRPKPIVVAKATSPAPSKKAASPDDAFEDAPAPAKGSPDKKRVAILAAYEKGNADGSLEAAKKANDRELAARLQDFINVYEAADSAMNSNNGGAAIKNFEKALKLDEGLSSGGWGVYAGRIRKQLASLYTLVGLQHIKNDNTENAKLAFQAALKHDPDNERAKSQLAKLGGGDEKKPSKAAAAAPADDEEARPAPKKKSGKKSAAEPKSRAQAIDDAFGD